MTIRQNERGAWKVYCDAPGCEMYTPFGSKVSQTKWTHVRVRQVAAHGLLDQVTDRCPEHSK